MTTLFHLYLAYTVITSLTGDLLVSWWGHLVHRGTERLLPCFPIP